jgi:hypothetical protein
MRFLAFIGLGPVAGLAAVYGVRTIAARGGLGGH